MKKKSPFVFVLGTLAVMIVIRTLTVKSSAQSKSKKGLGLKSFYAELRSLGYASGDGGEVLFRKSLVQPRCEKAFLRIYVASAAPHFERRQAIRSTWARWIANVTVIFVVGKGNSDLDVVREARHSGDILQGNFTDSYDNLVFKSALMLSHFGTVCPAEYLLKTDDDIFVNIPLLVRYVVHDRPRGIIGCDKSQESPPPIGFESASLTSLRKARIFKRMSFVVGAGYLIEKSTALRLRSGCRLAAPIPVEDVYVTSRCAQYIGQKPIHHDAFSCGQRLEHPCEMQRAFTGHHVSAKNMPVVFRTLVSGVCSPKSFS